jgi:type IV secretion system protein VirD4
MISKLKLFFKWGISFDEPYILADKGARHVSYLGKDKLMPDVEVKYPQKKEKIEEEFDDATEKKVNIKT